MTPTSAHTPRRGALLAAVLAPIALSLVFAHGAFAASNASMGPLLQGSSSGAEDYLYTAGNTIFTQAIGFKANTEYRYEVVAPDGTTIKQASTCFANGSPQSDSYTVSAGDGASGASGYSYRIVEFTGANRVTNCGTGTSGTVDDTKFFDVVVPTVDGTSAFSGNQTLFSSSGTAFVKLAGAVNRSSTTGTAAAVSSSATLPQWNVTWLNGVASQCANNAGSDRPPSSATALLPDPSGTPYLQFQPSNGATGAFNLATAYDSGLCPPLADGTYSVQITLQPASGSSKQFVTVPAFAVDATGPSVAITGAPSAATNQSTPAFSGTAGTQAADSTHFADGSQVTVKIYQSGSVVRTLTTTASGGSWSISSADWTTQSQAPLPDGPYTAQAEQSDTAGNLGQSAGADFTVDSSAPVVTLTSPTSGQEQSSQTPSLSGAAANTFTDNSTITVKIYSGHDTNGTLARTLTSTKTGDQWSIGASDWSTQSQAALPDGTYTAQASQSDTAGNVGTSSAITFKVDHVLPAVTISSPANNVASSDTRLPFSGSAGTTAASDTASADSGQVTLKIYSGAFATGSVQRQITVNRSGGSWSISHSDWDAQTTDLGQGQWTAQAEQTDGAGNVGQSTAVTFRIDTDAPTSSDSAPDSTNSNPITVNYSDSDMGASQSGVASIQLYVKRPGDTGFSAVNGAVVNNPTGSGSFDYTAAAGEGRYFFSTVAVDRAGNSEAQPTSYKALSHFDTSAPVVAITSSPAADGNSPVPAFSGSSGMENGNGEPSADGSVVTLNFWSGTGTSGSPARTFSITRGSDGSWSLPTGAWDDNVTTKAHLPDGTWTAKASQTDAAGNSGQSTPVTFRVDTVSPTVTLVQPADPGNDSTPPMSGTAGAADGTDAAISVDSNTVAIDIWSGTGTAGSPARTLTVTRSGSSWTLGNAPWDDNVATKAHLGDGTWTARARQSDGAGNSGLSTARTFKVDTTAPLVTLVQPTSVSTNTTPLLNGAAGSADGSDAASSADSGSVTVQLWHSTSASGPADRTFTVSRSGSSWSLQNGDWTTGAQAPLTEGEWTARATQSDGAGNGGSSLDRHFTVDLTNPNVGVSLTPSNPNGTNNWYTSQPAVHVTATDAHLSSISCTVDGGTPATYLSGASVPVTGEGSHSVDCTATDSAGNQGSDSKSFKVDSIDPSVGLSLTPSSPNGANSWYTSQPTVHLTATDTNPVVTSCTVDGSGATPDGSGNLAVSGDGSHTVSCTGTDSAGNQGSDTKNFKVDSTTPSSTASSPSTSTSTTIHVGYTASDGAGSGLSKVELWAKGPGDSSYAKVGEDSSPAASGHHIDYSAAVGDGPYRFYTIARDAAGNAEAAPANDASSQVTTTQLDSSAPVTTDDVPSGFQSHDVTVTLTAVDPPPNSSGVAHTYYTTDGSTPTTGSSVYDPAHKPLLHDGQAIRYFSTDGDGNVEPVKTSKVAHVDTSAPAISSSNDGQTYTQGSAAIVAYTCTDSGGSGLASCAGDRANGAPLDTASVGSHSYTVNATDQVGNHSAKTVSYTVTVHPANQPGGGGGGGGGDKTPPTVTLAGLPASVALSGGALGFSFKCSEDCTWGADGTVNVPGAARAFRLKRKSGSAKAGTTVKVTLKLDRKTQAAVRKALAKGIKVTAQVNVQVTDGAGNTRLVTRTIRIKKR